MLKVHAKISDNKVIILSLRGQIVMGETDILRVMVQSLPETSAVILDLTRVSKVDAHGLGVLLELREQIQANGIRFELMNVSKPLSGILELTHLDSVFQITSGVGFIPSVSSERRQPMAALKSCA
ncbi:MAG TPA: STAS domain-containing protein [Pyrinomonadaceae bacterium]|nr:STAS domain-containing protein [Pyrinomonadaceae bacterium]